MQVLSSSFIFLGRYSNKKRRVSQTTCRLIDSYRPFLIIPSNLSKSTAYNTIKHTHNFKPCDLLNKTQFHLSLFWNFWWRDTNKLCLIFNTSFTVITYHFPKNYWRNVCRQKLIGKYRLQSSYFLFAYYKNVSLDV